MEVEINLVPAGGGEVHQTLSCELPALPREGDYLVVMNRISKKERKTEQEVTGRPDNDFVGAGDSFIVRKVWWFIDAKDRERPKTSISVDAECADWASSSKYHREYAKNSARGEVKTFDISNY